MSRSQAHVLLQHQHQQTTLSREYNTMLPRLSELDISLGANGGSGLSSPLRLNGDGIHAHPPRGGHVDNVPQVPPPPNPISPSSHKPWYDHPSVTSRESSRWQPNTGTIGRSTGGFQPQQPAQQQQQQQPQQQQQRKIQQYQSVIGGMQQTSQISSSSPANQYSSPMQVQHPVTVEWWNNEPDPPWSPVSTRNQVPGPHHRNSVEGSHAHKSSLDSGIPISPRRKESGPVALRPGDVIHHNHGENVRQISARLVCIPEYHERSASCPALHPATSFLQRPGDTPTFPRNTTTSNMRSENHYASGPFHDQSMGKAQGSSPETPRMLQNGVRKNMDDKHMHVSMQGTRSEVRTGHTNDMVLGWMSSPRSEPKITASNTLDATTTPTATPTSHHDSQETRHSNKFMGDLTSPSGITWEKNPGEPSFRPYAVNYYPNNNVNNPETTGASGGSMNETGHGDSNAMEEYESDRHPSQTQRASMASSTTSSETTNARMSDSGSVTKRRSISAPKREYRCTKKDGCDAVFSCNSLRKKHEMKHTKPFICSQRSCPKHKVGFTTSNDLRRHMKALHGFRYKSSVASPSSRGMSGVPGGDGSVDGGDTAEAVPPADAVGGWRCKYCAQMEAPNPIGHANPSKGFFSTRKDNFRNHIKRIHSGLRREKETMDDFFRRSEVECRVDSPVLLPTVPSPETPLVMDTDMDSPEVGSARGFGGRRHGMGEQSGNFGLRGREERERLPSVEEWQGLPPPASNTRAVTHGHTRSDILPPQDTISTEVAGKGDYHSTLDRRQADRNANCGQQHQIQQNDQARGMMSGQHHQLQRSNRENADSLEKRGGDYLSLGRNNNSQVERFTGPEHPTGSSRLTSMSSNGWTSVNTSSYNHRAAAHTDGSRTEGYNFATHTHESSAVRDAGARSEEISMPHAHLHIVGAEELRRLDQEEENMLRELERIRAQRKKLLEQLSQSRLLSSSQPTPVRRTHIAESDQDVEMVDCEASHPSSKCSAQAEKQIPSASGPGRTSVSVSQLLNAEDGSPSGPIGKTTSPSITPGNMNAVQEASAMVHENLFLPPKSASPPPPRWQFPPVAGVTGSPRGKSTAASNTSNALRGSTEVAPFRRPQSWYNNRIKPGTVPSKDNNKEYKAFCPHCQSSFRLPCQLRKHLKRHSKPFGCTHDGCNKVFGAKNDWKRHENSQHHQLECWKCDIRCLTATAGAASDTPDICGKCFFRKADFVKHLKMVHGNADGWAVTSANQAGGATTGDQLPTTITHTGNRDLGQIISDCHIPKFHGGAFWCGFCHRVIKLHGKVGIEGWDKRFDHIAWHFEKDNLRVKDTWMRLEEPSPEDDGKGPGASSAKGVDDSSDEDDGDVDLNDSSPRRRQTEPTPLPSYARQSQLKGTEGAPGRGKETSEKWYCCKCEYGPFLTALYVDCPHCTRHHRCDNCKEQIVTKPCK